MMRTQLGLVLLTSSLCGCPDQGVQAFNAHPEVTITSHGDGDTVQEGVGVQLWGYADDPDHDSSTLIATWYTGAVEACPATALDADGMTSCEVVLGEDDGRIILEVADPGDAVGSATVNLTVLATSAPTAQIIAPSAEGVYYSDQLVIFQAQVSDEEDTPDQLVTTWDSSLSGDLGIDAPPDDQGGVLGSTYLDQGEQLLTLTVQDSTGKTGSDAVSITVGPPNTPPSCLLTAPQSGAAGPQGELVVFEGSVSDEDVQADWLQVTWASDKDGELGTSTPSSAGEVLFAWDDLSVATHTVTMTVQDEVGATCADHLLYTVGTAPSITLLEPGSGEVFNEGEAITFTAEVSDGEERADALALVWETDLSGIISTQGATSSGEASFQTAALPAGAHGLTVTVTDSDGLDDSALANFTVNALPTAPAVSIAPDPATTVDDLVATASGSTDPDASGTVTYGYAWYESGVLSSASSSASFPASASTRGLVYKVVVTPSDGLGYGTPGEAEIVIANSAPSLASVTISPDPAVAGDTLTCLASGFSDADGDPDLSTFAWTIDGVGAGSGATLAGGFVAGDTVTCAVTPHDGSDSGAAVSDSLVVSNTPPVLASVVLSPDPAYTSDTMLCSPGLVTDVDGDATTTSYTWTVDGVDPGVTGTTLGSFFFTRGQTVRCHGTPNDGSDDGATVSSDSVTIDNTAPALGSVTITPDPATSSDTLSCGYAGFTDADGDADASTIEWSAGSASLGTGSTLATGFARGDSVTCTVTPFDGSDAGTPLSDSVTIDNSPPWVSSVGLSPSAVYTDDSVSAVVSATDADGDAVILSYDWYVDGSLTAATGSSLSGVSHFDKHQIIHVEVTPSDASASGAAVASASVTVLNTPPEAPTVSIAPTEPVEAADDLVCGVDVASWDADGDSVSYGFTWAVDGAAYSPGASADTADTGAGWLGPSATTWPDDTVPAEDTIAAELWSCTVTPDDGDDLGSSAGASVEILSGSACGTPTVIDTYNFDGMTYYPLDLDNCTPHIGACCAPTTTQEQLDALCQLAGLCVATDWDVELRTSTNCYCWGSCTGYAWYSNCCSGSDARYHVVSVTCE
jgi:hypothetical protein